MSANYLCARHGFFFLHAFIVVVVVVVDCSLFFGAFIMCVCVSSMFPWLFVFTALHSVTNFSLPYRNRSRSHAARRTCFMSLFVFGLFFIRFSKKKFTICDWLWRTFAFGWCYSIFFLFFSIRNAQFGMGDDDHLASGYMFIVVLLHIHTHTYIHNFSVYAFLSCCYSLEMILCCLEYTTSYVFSHVFAYADTIPLNECSKERHNVYFDLDSFTEHINAFW